MSAKQMAFVTILQRHGITPTGPLGSDDGAGAGGGELGGGVARSNLAVRVVSSFTVAVWLRGPASLHAAKS